MTGNMIGSAGVNANLPTKAPLGSERWVYQVWDPATAAWSTVQKFTHPDFLLGGFGRVSFSLENGRQGSAGRFCDTLTGDVVDVTQYVRARDIAADRLRQIASDHAYQVIAKALASSDGRYYVVVEYPHGFWEPAETTRYRIPRGYKTLRSALNALWKRHDAKSGLWGERYYALVDLHCERVIRESIIDIAKFMNVTRPLLRRKATVAMLEQLIPEDRMPGAGAPTGAFCTSPSSSPLPALPDLVWVT